MSCGEEHCKRQPLLWLPASRTACTFGDGQAPSTEFCAQAANELDLEAARKSNLDPPLLKRLDVRGKKFDVMLSKLDEVRAVADPVGNVQLATKLDDGLDLYRVACPIGVVAGEAYPSRTQHARPLNTATVSYHAAVLGLMSTFCLAQSSSSRVRMPPCRLRLWPSNLRTRSF